MVIVTGQSDWGGIHSNVKSFRADIYDMIFCMICIFLWLHGSLVQMHTMKNGESMTNQAHPSLFTYPQSLIELVCINISRWSCRSTRPSSTTVCKVFKWISSEKHGSIRWYLSSSECYAKYGRLWRANERTDVVESDSCSCKMQEAAFLCGLEVWWRIFKWDTSLFGKRRRMSHLLSFPNKVTGIMDIGCNNCLREVRRTCFHSRPADTWWFGNIESLM